ncbi:MAG TPA: YqgE/AlgH family protein [Cryptosporangiaceae bacterium]|nr:YqgE/AlgH family protein [Cryptosporangiaceae bacterium]
MITGMPEDSLTGKLLVATPSLKDPNFERAVVLLIAHEDSGALGVVINRATEVHVGEVLAGWDTLAVQPPVVFEGGPVQPEAAICLARLRAGTEPDGFSRVDGSIVGTVDLTTDPAAMAAMLDQVRVFAGYAGWGPDQLEHEVSEGAWLVLEALPGDPFAPQPDDLWSTVLRRQGGMLGALAFYPADPTLN